MTNSAFIFAERLRRLVIGVSISLGFLGSLCAKSHAPDVTQAIDLCPDWNLHSVQVGDAPRRVADLRKVCDGPGTEFVEREGLVEIWTHKASGMPSFSHVHSETKRMGIREVDGLQTIRAFRGEGRLRIMGKSIEFRPEFGAAGLVVQPDFPTSRESHRKILQFAGSFIKNPRKGSFATPMAGKLSGPS